MDVGSGVYKGSALRCVATVSCRCAVVVRLRSVLASLVLTLSLAGVPQWVVAGKSASHAMEYLLLCVVVIILYVRTR